MKNLILIPIILLMTNSISAEKNSSEKKQQARLDYEECIQLYGVDDTSIAIINIRPLHNLQNVEIVFQ